jgi:ferredoxin-nitrite reductase
MSNDFSTDQKRYLEGFVTGVQAGKLAGGGAKPAPEPTGPDAIHFKAQDATTARGGKLVDQEKWKRAEHPFDAYSRLKGQAAAAEYPKPEDNFRWRYHGLFYVAPAQNSYMCRLRIPNGILKAHQFAGLADVAEQFAGPYSHVTTRANLQLREIPAENTVAVLEAIQELGLCSRGSGADNIRNVTGGATAGIDPQEIADTRALAREWHFHILNDRSLYGLPRKFNVAFDGGGAIPTLEETNDIGFQAVVVDEAGAKAAGVEPGVWWRVVLGGISGHRDLARPTGVFCRAAECTPVADAMIRVFIAHGDRTNRARARLKYVLDAWGFDRFISETETVLGRTLARIPESAVAPRPPFDRMAHVGVHPQRQSGLNWIGVALPVGKLTTAQMRGLAALSTRLGDGDIRLTVWQNLLIAGVADDDVADVIQGVASLGLSVSATALQAGLVACTGKTGCKFAASHTKEDALAIAAHIDARLTLDQPVNVHLTGCHHSCAQHYIGDIGLIGAKVPINEDGDTVEGYDIVVGGGFGADPRIGRELIKGVKATDAAAEVEALLRAWLAARADAAETFQSFANRHDPEALRALASQHRQTEASP